MSIQRTKLMYPTPALVFLDAQANRARGWLPSRRDEPGEARAYFETATGIFHEIRMPFWLAVTALEQTERLVGKKGQAISPFLDESRATFEPLQAKPWIERLEKLSSGQSNLPASPVAAGAQGSSEPNP